MLCESSGDVTWVRGRFWAWEYWWELLCPECGGRHPSLDRAEFEGLDRDLSSRLDAARHMRRDTPRRLARRPIDQLTDADIDISWSANAEIWDAGYDDRGDDNRRYASDPVLLTQLGEVSGRRILDAGSGNGYLCRLLAQRGARMTGVENSAGLFNIAVKREQETPRGIDYHHASISSMSFLDADQFEGAVANYVLMDVLDFEAALAEIARVLTPGGRLVAAISLLTLDFGWISAVPDSPRQEDRIGWLDDDYFVRRAGLIEWGNLKPFWSFHRPLADYVRAAHKVGLRLRDLDEPELTDEGKRELAPWAARSAERVAASCVVSFEKPGSTPQD